MILLILRQCSIAIDSEHHVLAFTGEDRCRRQHFLLIRGPNSTPYVRVEDLFGELRGRHHNQVVLAHSEQENFSKLASDVGEAVVVEAIANLEPVAEYGQGNRAKWELEALAT